jgi:hypothetical protein
LGKKTNRHENISHLERKNKSDKYIAVMEGKKEATNICEN